MITRDPIAVAVAVTDEVLGVQLADGRVITVPIDCYPRLVHATPQERNRTELLGRGSAIGWPELDEHLSNVKTLSIAMSKTITWSETFVPRNGSSHDRSTS